MLVDFLSYVHTMAHDVIMYGNNRSNLEHLVLLFLPLVLQELDYISTICSWLHINLYSLSLKLLLYIAR